MDGLQKRWRRLRIAVSAACIALTMAIGGVREAHSFAYIFSGEANGVDLITHVLGYTGVGGAIGITVGIDPMREEITVITGWKLILDNQLGKQGSKLAVLGSCRCCGLCWGWCGLS